MKYKKEAWNYQSLEDILTGEQLNLLERWLDMNGLEYVEYRDDMLYGITVYANNRKSGESWGIDFIRKKVGGGEE